MTATATVGDRIRLIRTSDEWSDLEPGALGNVRFIDALGTLHMEWDNGSTLGLIPGEDEFEVLYHDKQEEE